MKRFILILLIFILLFNVRYVFPQGLWHYYTDELPGVVIEMTQDKYENYWFATTNGVCEFDTNGCWHYLVDSSVWDTTMYFKNRIVIDNENNKWFVGLAMSNATKEYVVKYDDSAFTYYNPSGREKDTWIQSLGIDSSGNIWAGSMANWAYWFDGNQWHPFYVPGTTIYDPISVFRTDQKGILYIGHTNGISTVNGYIWGDYAKGVNSFGIDSDNRLWFGTSGLGVYDGSKWVMYTTDDGLLANATIVAVDSNQNIWVSYGESAKGVSRLNDGNWEHMTSEDGLLDDAVGPMYVDKNGAIWFSTIFIKGLSVYQDTTTTGVKLKINANNAPEIFTLKQNFPNPFNLETTILYELKQDTNIQLSIFNLNGKEVKRLVSDNKQKGIYQIAWNGKDNSGKEVGSGIYFYVLNGENFKEIKKMTLIK
jgi:ligand-binding sensor domain-containing protein